MRRMVFLAAVMVLAVVAYGQTYPRLNTIYTAGKVPLYTGATAEADGADGVSMIQMTAITNSQFTIYTYPFERIAPYRVRQGGAAVNDTLITLLAGQTETYFFDGKPKAWILCVSTGTGYVKGE